jgi:hypothetical protein
MEMICRKCSAYVGERSRYCVHCGAEIGSEGGAGMPKTKAAAPSPETKTHGRKSIFHYDNTQITYTAHQLPKVKTQVVVGLCGAGVVAALLLLAVFVPSIFGE